MINITALKSLRQNASVIVFAAVISLSSCVEHNDRAVKKALNRAGDNRAELETVLTHYADMPEKQAAAKWLIANMDGHYGYEGSLLDSVETTLSLIKDIMPTAPLPDSIVEIWNRRNLYALPRRADLTSITAKMLIENIDQAYAQWKGRKWNSELSFEDFCEYILPYRMGDERLIDWRPAFDSIFARQLDSLYQGDDVIEAIKAVWTIIDSFGPRSYCDELSTPYRDPLAMLSTRVGNCRDDCALIAGIMRACGIPVAIDCMLPAPDSGVSHTWLSFKDNKTKRWYPFGYDDMPVSRDSIVTDGRVKGKVYRYMFARQRAPKESNNTIRIESNHSHAKDVTSNYFGRNRVEVDYNGSDAPMLASWTKGSYIILGQGEKKGNKAVFKDLEPGCIFFPATMKNGQILAAGYPFVLDDDGKTCELKPISNQKNEVVTVRRKTPLVWRKRLWIDDRIQGLTIEASPNRDFKNPDTLISITGRLDNVVATHNPTSNNVAKFIRIMPSSTGEITFAGFKLSEKYDGTDTIGVEFETAVPHHVNTKKLTDDDPLTFVEWLNATPLVARLKKPSMIRRVELTARNDDNFIVEGREYELFWHDGSRGWQSAGRKVATERSVSFDVPKGVVCIVRCLTTGREEQPFIWRNNRQMFSLDLSKAQYK